MTPTLRREIGGEIARLYRDSRKRAAIGLDRYGELEPPAQLPDTCPYTFDQILEDDWYPEPVEKP